MMINLDRDGEEQRAWFDALPKQSLYVLNALSARDNDLTGTISFLVQTAHAELLDPSKWGGIECMLEWAVTQWPSLYEPEVCKIALQHIQVWRMVVNAQ